MLRLILKWILNAVAFVLTAYVVNIVWPGSFTIAAGFGTPLIAVLVLGLVNTFIRPIIKILTFPINFLTLGLFSLVVNALLLMLVGNLVDGIVIQGFLPAVLGAILLSVFGGILTAIL